VTGRPRDPELEGRLLLAAWELLKSDGYDALSMTKVAAKADAHRTDVYRRWSTKAQLVTDTLAEHLPPVVEVDTGSLAGDVRAYIGDLAKAWSSDWVDGLMGLTGDLRNDPDAELAWRNLANKRGGVMRLSLQRAIDRGELPELPDLTVAGDLFEGPLMHRRMIGRQPLTPEYLDAVAAVAVRILTAGVTA
jgi:AcrR family transcriptional regulator